VLIYSCVLDGDILTYLPLHNGMASIKFTARPRYILIIRWLCLYGGWFLLVWWRKHDSDRGGIVQATTWGGG